MEVSMELRKFVTPEIIIGKNARQMIGRYLVNYTSTKPLIVTDQNIIKFNWFDDIIEEIKKWFQSGLFLIT